jgi:hypothetical protein
VLLALVPLALALLVQALQVLLGPQALLALARAGLLVVRGVACLFSSNYQFPQRRICGITSRSSSLE